jgi:hypothetical protein
MSWLKLEFTVRRMLDFSGEFRKRFREELNQSIRETCNAIRNEARRMAPVDTGKLKRGYRTRLNKRRMSGRVVSSSSIPYPVNVEYGTSVQEGHPHLGPAGRAQVAPFKQRVEGAMRKATS